MKIEHMNYFLETVSSRSINQASKKLYLNHQYLGQILDNVEKELGTKLLNRSRTGVELTFAGKKAMPLIKDIVEKYDILISVLDDVKKNTANKITLNIYMSANLEPVNLLHAIDQLQQDYSNIDVLVQECTKDEIVNELSKSDHSIALINTVENELPDYLQSESIFEMIPLKKWPLSALVHHNSPLIRQYKSISLKTLMTYDIILYAPFEEEQLPVYSVLKQAASGAPLIKCMTSNLHIFHNMMKRERSITLGVSKIDYAPEQNLVAIPLRDNITITSVLLIRKDTKDDPAIQKLIDLCKKAYI